VLEIYKHGVDSDKIIPEGKQKNKP